MKPCQVIKNENLGFVMHSSADARLIRRDRLICFSVCPTWQPVERVLPSQRQKAANFPKTDLKFSTELIILFAGSTGP